MKKALSDFANIHSDKKIIVCGLGQSLNQFTTPGDFITIGCNDIGRKFTPNYLIVLNHLHSFDDERKHFIRSSKAEYVFSQLSLKMDQERLIHFKLGRCNGTNFEDFDSLDYTQNSPYVGICLAIHMGAKTIGFIGVDFTQDHFFKKSGDHSLTRQIDKINRQYAFLNEECRKRDISVYNLSEHSRIDAFERRKIEEL